MKKFIRNNVGEIITFVTTIFLFVIGLKIVGLFDNSIIISDLKTQVYPLLEHLKNSFIMGKLFFFDFSFGIGDSIFGILYYYLISPFNLLYFFINNPNTAIVTIIILKSAFASLFCYKFLRYLFKMEKRIIFMIFSLLYALSSYYVSYNMVVEFLDVYMLFPLVLLGIEKIIKEKKYFLYIISFMLVILSNYYFAYMVSIFSFIYFNYRIFSQKKEKELVKKNIRFIVVSFLVCLSMSFIFLPIVFEISSYSRGVTGAFKEVELYSLFNLRDIFNHYIIGNFNTIDVINQFSFYLYTSTIVFPLIYFYFINNKISKREKICTSVIFLILIVSIGFNYANYVWHGFGIPMGFNGRFTFMFILFIIMICTKSIYNIKVFNIKHYVIAFSMIYFSIFMYSIISYPKLITISHLFCFILIYFFIVIMSLIFKKYKFPIKYYLIGFGILLCIYVVCILIFGFNIEILLKILFVVFGIFVLLCLNKYKNFKFAHYFILFFIVLIPCSIYSFSANFEFLEIGTILTFIFLLSYLILLRYIPKYKKLSILLVLIVALELVYHEYCYLDRFPYDREPDPSYSEIISYIKNEDKSLFYRIEDNDFLRSINNSIFYNYYGIDYFMSTINNEYVKFFKDLGVKNYNTSDNSLLFDGSYHLISSLLGVKYYIDIQRLDNDYYEKINNISNYDIFKNNNSLSLGYMVDSGLKDIKYTGNGLEYLNTIYKKMSNNDEDVLEKVDVSSIDKKTYSFKNSSDKDFYLLIDSRVYGEIPLVYVNGEILDNPNNTNMYMVDNHYKLDEKVEIVIEADKKVYDNLLGVFVSYYDEDVYEDDIKILKENQLEITKINSNGFEGTIDVDKDGVLFLSCLYKDDLEIYVDDIKQDKEKLMNVFLGTELDKGKHKIVLKYKPKIMYISIILSIFSLIFLIVLFKKSKFFK